MKPLLRYAGESADRHNNCPMDTSEQMTAVVQGVKGSYCGMLTWLEGKNLLEYG